MGKGEIARHEQFLPFPHVFKRLVLQAHKNQGLFGKGLRVLCPYFRWTVFLNNPWYVLSLSQMTNFRFFRSERVCRRQFHLSWTWQKVLKMGRKHCGKRRIARYEQFLLFPQCFLKTCTADTWKLGLVWDSVNPFPNEPQFLCDCCTSLLKDLWENREIACNKQFLIFSTVFFNFFYPFWELSPFFIKFRIVVCKL